VTAPSLPADANGLDVDVTRLPGTSPVRTTASTGGESRSCSWRVATTAPPASVSADGDVHGMATAPRAEAVVHHGGSVARSPDGTMTANLAARRTTCDVGCRSLRLGGPRRNLHRQGRRHCERRCGRRHSRDGRAQGDACEHLRHRRRLRDAPDLGGSPLGVVDDRRGNFPPNAIGKLAANSGVDIGDVDVTDGAD
jgi:hypothetical protein